MASGKAGVVALAIAGTAFAGVAPVQAQSNPNIGFSLNFGNGGGPSGGFSFGGPRGGITLHFGDRDYFRHCLTNRQITSGLRDRGYRDVRIVREENRNNKVWVVAQKNRDWYQMRVDRCTGKVDRIREIDRRRDGGFSLNFSF